MKPSDLHIVFWGTYDLGKPRTRLLIENAALEARRTEIHADVWAGIEDKTRIRGRLAKARWLLRWLGTYPRLIMRYLRTPRHDAVVVLYMGHLDILVLWPWARLRRVPIVWDLLFNMRETLVDDRNMVRGNSGLGRLIWAWDWLALRAADCVVFPSAALRDLAVNRFGLREDRSTVIAIGAEFAVFPPTAPRPPECPDQLRILFYAQFAPMHGLASVVAAARAADGQRFSWRFIGRGQDDRHLSEWLAGENPANVTWSDSVPYARLAQEIEHADLCLGLFGDSVKAMSSLPNKLFQILSAGRALLTRDTPAVREVLLPHQTGVYLTSDGRPESIVAALEQAWAERDAIRQGPLHREWRARFTPRRIGEAFTHAICETVARVRSQ